MKHIIDPLPKHVLFYYKRQRGQGIPPLVDRYGSKMNEKQTPLGLARFFQ